MKDIIEICKDFGFEVPAEKHADFRKAVAGNYKTVEEHNTKIATLTKRAETAEEALKGFDGLTPDKIKEQLEDANKKIKEAQEEAAKQLADRDFNDALKIALDGIKFTSSAAKRAFEADVRASCTKVKDGTIIGFSDVLAVAKKNDADAFVDEGKAQAEENKPRFSAPAGNGNPGGATTLKDIMKIKDPVERQKMIGQNMHLFGKKGE